MLTEREKDVLTRFYPPDGVDPGLSLADVGRVLGITRERVRQLRDQAMGKVVRRYLYERATV